MEPYQCSANIGLLVVLRAQDRNEVLVMAFGQIMRGRTLSRPCGG